MDTLSPKAANAIPLLADLEEGCLGRLLTAATVQRVPRDTIICREGIKPKSLHILQSGSVEAFTTLLGKEFTLVIYSPGDTFMPAAALVDEVYLVSVRTLKASTLLVLDAATVRREMRTCPQLAGRLASLLAGQLRAAFRHIKDIKTRSGPQRLTACLLRIFDEQQLAGVAELRISKGTLASRLSMSAETLSRSLQVVREHGITLRGRQIVLRDRDEVERFCHSDPLIDGVETELFVNTL